MAGGGVASPTDKLEHLQFTAEELKAITTVGENADLWVCITRQRKCIQFERIRN